MATLGDSLYAAEALLTAPRPATAEPQTLIGRGRRKRLKPDGLISEGTLLATAVLIPGSVARSRVGCC